MTDASNNPYGKPDSDSSNANGRGALIERPTQLPSTAFQHEFLHHGPEIRTNRFREYWEIVLRRRWTVLTCFAIVVVAVMTATFLTTKIHRSTLTLQVDQQESKNQVLGTAANQTDNSYYDSQNFYQTQYELLKSEALALRVIEQLNLVAPSQAAAKSKSWLDIFKKESSHEKQRAWAEFFRHWWARRARSSATSCARR